MKGRLSLLLSSPLSLRPPFSLVQRWSPRRPRISSPKRQLQPRKRNLSLRGRRASGRLGGSKRGLNFAPLQRPKWSGPLPPHLLLPPLAEAHMRPLLSQALSSRRLPRRIHQPGMRRIRLLALASSFEGLACKRRKSFTRYRPRPNAID